MEVDHDMGLLPGEDENLELEDIRSFEVKTKVTRSGFKNP